MTIHKAYKVTSVRADPDLMEMAKSMGYTLTEVFELGLKAVVGAVNDDLEELKSHRDELVQEKNLITSKHQVIEQRISELEKSREEQKEAEQHRMGMVEEAAKELYDYSIESYYSRNYDIARVRFLARKYCIKPETIINFIENKTGEDEIRATVKSEIEAQAEY